MDKKQSTKVTKRGQTVIPASIRERYSIQPGDRLAWIDDGEVIKVIPVPPDRSRLYVGADMVKIHWKPYYKTVMRSATNNFGQSIN